MSTLAEFMILSGGDNRPPMLEKALYDSWKSRMELYMQIREHGRMILESVEHDPLIWPTIEENGVTRTKKYAKLSASEKIEADCDLKATNIILQELPPDVYALVNHHRVAKDLWERVQLLMQVYQDACPQPQSIPQIEYTVSIVNQQTHLAEFPQIDSGLAVSVFKQGDDPIDAINKMMSFLDNISGTGGNNSGQQRVVKSFNCQEEGFGNVLNEEESAFLADPGVAEGLVTQTVITHNAAYHADDLDAYDFDCDEISTAKAEKESLTTTFNVLKNESKEKEAKNIDKEIALKKKVKELDNIVYKIALGFQNPFYPKKAQQIRPMIYDGSVIANETNVFSIADLEENLMLEEESRSKMLLKQNFGKHFVPQQELSDEQAFWLQTSHPNTDESAPSPVKIEAPRELPKVSLVNTSLKKLKYHLGQFDTVVKKQITPDALTKGEWGKLKGNDVVDNAAQVSNATTIAPGMYKIDLVSLAHTDKNNRENSASYSVCKYVKLIQELLGYVRDTCPHIHKPSEKFVTVTPINKKKIVRSKSTDNTKNDRILQISSSTQKKNKVEDHSRIVNSMFDARHELCFLEFVSNMNACSKSKSVKKAKKKEEWKPTGKVITITNEVPLRVPIPLEVVAQEPVIAKVYTRRPKVIQIVLWYPDSRCSEHMIGNRSQLMNFVSKFMGTVRFRNNQIAKIMGYGDYQLGNVIISRVYYVEGIGHNLFSVGQFYDADLEVAFRKNTFFIQNLEDVDLLTRSRDINLSKDEAPDVIIKCIKNIQVRLNAAVRNVRTDNGTEFFNQTLHDFYENVGISHQTYVARTPQ
ncbi:integrase, catalytic region, zinc finger, CCHC-type containing protein [Tanacetum coccineum]